jgi:ligand-binding sensor domain-containing protein
MKRILFLSFLIRLLPCSSFAQEYSYTHFDISDGLAGSTIYCITQDKSGFIWTGTETGVSRFDGTHFVTYTTKDGLPDVEILNMFADSKGRVWMAPFSKSICYYYNGRIYNQENDSLLMRIRLGENIQRFAEDKDGNILVQESRALQLIGREGQVVQFDSIGGKPITDCYAICRSQSGHFLIQEKNIVCELADRHFALIYSSSDLNFITHPAYVDLSSSFIVWRYRNAGACLFPFYKGKPIYFPFTYVKYKHLGWNIIGDSLIYRNELSGSLEYNIRTKKSRHFLPGKDVSKVFRDDEGNTWFTTLGSGLFRLNSDNFRNIKLGPVSSAANAVYMIRKVGKELLVGTGDNSVLKFRLPDLDRYVTTKIPGGDKGRVIYAERLQDRQMLFGTGNGIIKVGPSYYRIEIGVKSFFRMDNGELLFACSSGAFSIDPNGPRIIDTLWRERTTTIFYSKGMIYIGTMNGLYMIGKDKSTVDLGQKIPLFKKRISAIVESKDGTLWVSSYDDSGVVGYKDGRVTAVITTREGLSSDICRTMYTQGNYLWVGTDKGLNRITLNGMGYPVVQYTYRDGLASNVVNVIYADSPRVYVGTAAGVSFFDETDMNRSAGCRLLWLGIASSGNDRTKDTAHLELPYTGNNIRFEFVGISYKSVGEIRYRYRLSSLDTAWKESRQTFLDYPSLPSGDYKLQLIAQDKFGTQSNMLSLHFRVQTPFWRTTWFLCFLILCFLMLTWLLVSFRLRRIRKQQRERERLTRKMAEMEHTALKAQMNPHFIFNCLSSIQQLIFEKDEALANKYIVGLARLIRATLNNSSKPLISVQEEINYLSTYLTLEKLRFKEKMNFSIEVAPDIDQTATLIPPMLTQPYAENSMRHGLRHKTDGNGFISVELGIVGENLVVSIRDNGIGREKAALYKTREHIEYQSKGMVLTTDRIRMINALYDRRIEVQVVDLLEDGQPGGTLVILTLPLFHKTTQKLVM